MLQVRLLWHSLNSARSRSTEYDRNIMPPIKTLLAMPLLAISCATFSQQDFLTQQQARQVASFFEKYEAVYAECKELMKSDFARVTDMRTHLSRLRFACDRNRSAGIPVPEDIPIETSRDIRDGIACFHFSWSTTEKLVARKLKLDEMTDLSDNDRKILMKAEGEKEIPALSACMPKILRSSDIGIAAKRALR